MRKTAVRLTTLILGFAAATLTATCAFADDTEIFFSQITSSSSPNILFILDTSGSMDTQVATTTPYNPSMSYTGTGNCFGVANRVYYATGSNQGTPPGCNGNYFNLSYLKCAAALAALASGGTGRYQDALIRWRGNGSNRGWRDNNFNNNNPTDVECLADSGGDGNLQTANPYPRGAGYTSNSANGVWTATSGQSYWPTGTQTQYSLFSGNYVTWYNQFRSQSSGTRMSIMQDAGTNLLTSLSGVNVGLMRYSTTARGGMVSYAMSPIETNRTSLINTLQGYSANGFTPLSETLYESYLYFSGGAVRFGNTSQPSLSVPGSRDPANTSYYASPADYSCHNYIVYLTDGLPTEDDEANAAIQALPNFATLGGSCLAAGSGPESSYPNSGLCLGALAQYMFNGDLRTGSGISAGQQNVRSYFIGLGDDFVTNNELNTAFQYLQSAATRGGGNAYQAGDTNDLTNILASIAAEVKQDSASFTSPTVAVNAFNRTRMLNQLYFSMFQPTSTYHWPGNVKKYQIVNGEIVDDSSPTPLPAVEQATGMFKDSSKSFWSDAADGNEVKSGGAANKLPLPANRKVYTYIGANPGSTPVALASNSVAVTNALLTDALLGTSASGDPSRDKLIDWARGADVNDENGDQSFTDTRHTMGDPIHSQPAVVIYGGSASNPDLNDAVVYVATNDGYLHAFDTASGIELWSFIPQELLGDLLNLYNDDPTPTKHYSLDGDVVVLKYDVNGNGVIETAQGDRVLLFVGQGRGGSNYYALDITDKNNPNFMWRLGPTELPGIGQAWGTPIIARVKVGNGSSQTSIQKFVLIISGGYDQTEDGNSTAGTYLSADTVGRRLFMVDILSGNLLWSGGPASSSTTQQFGNRMTHSFPAAPVVIDLNSDGYADRMYAGDMGGQVWRFDITNGNAANNLVTGGVIASLGAHDDSFPPATANARRFYSTPDASLVTRPGSSPYINIAIGSGYRGHPLNTSIQDRLYGLRDYAPYSTLTQADFSSYSVVHDGDLVDVTGSPAPPVPANAKGWKYTLNQHGGWVGEKSLASATTIGGVVYFTTYTPNTASPATPCAPATGTNRVYALSVYDGEAGVDLNNDGSVTAADTSTTIAEGAIAADVKVLFLNEKGDDTCVGSNCTPPCVGANCPPPPCTGANCIQCVVGKSTVACPTIDQFTKTFWREGAAN